MVKPENTRCAGKPKSISQRVTQDKKKKYLCRGVVPGGARSAMPPPPQILADQLNLSQPGGADFCPPH